MSEAWLAPAEAPHNIPADTLARVQTVLPAANGPHPLHAPEIGGNAWDYVRDCLDTGWVSSVGSWVDRFEQMLADATGARHAIATVNGTAALHAALLVAGVKPGDEILVPSFSFVATANAVSYCGATAHFVDCEAVGLGIDPVALDAYLDETGERHGEILVNRRTGSIIRAMVPVHCYGHPANMPALCEVAARHGLGVIEDAAESLGATIDGTHTGRFGRIGALSFNGNKTITTGGGGAVITDDDLMARRLRHLTTTARAGDGRDLVHDMVAYNYRMPNLNAALGCAELESLDTKLAAKRTLADAYRNAFADAPGVHVAVAPPWGESSHWLNVILFDDPACRDSARALLEEAGYQCRPLWAPLHRMPMYTANPRADLVTGERLGACGLALPSGAGLEPATGR